MAGNPLFSTYRQRENRITAAVLAVFERVGADVTARVLQSADRDHRAIAFGEFANQRKAQDSKTVADARISGDYCHLFEFKTEDGGARLEAQVEANLDDLARQMGGNESDPDGERYRLWVISPDAEAPAAVAEAEHPLAANHLSWLSFADLSSGLSAALEDVDDPVAERDAVLLRELRTALLNEGLSTPADTLVVAGGTSGWSNFKASGLYVCQANRSFRPVTYLAFYVDGAIQPEVSRILASEPDVMFDPEGFRQFEARHPGSAERLQAVVDYDPSRAGEAWSVFLLDAVQPLEAPVAQRSAEGGRTAWVQGHRYASLQALRAATTTADLR